MMKGFIKDISAGGFFIETGIALLVNQEYTITFSLPYPEDPNKMLHIFLYY